MKSIVCSTILMLVVTSSARSELVIDKAEYTQSLRSFWLAQCMANWTGLITENQKKEPPFHTDEAWGKKLSFKYGGRTVPEDAIPTWDPAAINRAFADDNTMTDLTFLEIMDQRGFDVLKYSSKRDPGFKSHWNGRNNITLTTMLNNELFN